MTRMYPPSHPFRSETISEKPVTFDVPIYVCCVNVLDEEGEYRVFFKRQVASRQSSPATFIEGFRGVSATKCCANERDQRKGISTRPYGQSLVKHRVARLRRLG